MKECSDFKKNHKKTKTPTLDQLQIFKEVSLYDIFSKEDAEIFLKDTKLNSDAYDGHSENSIVNPRKIRKYSDNTTTIMNTMSSFNFLFDRMTLIIKLINFSIEKLKGVNENVACKGLEWVKKEVEELFVSRPDEKTLEHLTKIKEEHRDIQNILSWVEEYSNLNQNQKEMLNSLKNKNIISMTPKDIQTSPILFQNSSFNNFNINNDKNEQKSPNDSNFLYNYIKTKSKNNLESNKETFNYITNYHTQDNFLNFKDDIIVKIDQPNFDIFQFEKSVGQHNTLTTISCYIFITLDLYSIIDYSNFENFIEQIAKGYSKKNPYHTDLHAADVEQTCYTFLKFGQLKESLYLTNLDCASFLISAIIHDFKHPGVNNNFLINSKNEIAVRYNENFHVSESFKIILNNKHCDIFSELSADDYKIMRKRIIECVLATDMTLHNREFSYLKLKKETYQISNGENVHKIFENLDNITMFKTQQEFLNTLIHSADISNPTKPLHVYKNWTNLVLEEFWLQGDKEKEMKLPVSFMCDRNTTKIPDSQLGFIDGIVMPIVQVIVEFFPNLNFLTENLRNNKIYFRELKQKDEKESLNKK